MLSVAIAMAVGASLLGFAGVVGAQSSPPRFPDLPKEGMTDAQKRVYDAIAGGLNVAEVPLPAGAASLW